MEIRRTSHCCGCFGSKKYFIKEILSINVRLNKYRICPRRIRLPPLELSRKSKNLLRRFSLRKNRKLIILEKRRLQKGLMEMKNQILEKMRLQKGSMEMKNQNRSLWMIQKNQREQREQTWRQMTQRITKQISEKTNLCCIINSRVLKINH